MRDRRDLLLHAVLFAVVAVGAMAATATTEVADTLPLDLDACLAQALATAPILEAAAAATDEARALADEAAARRRPVLGAGAGYQYTSEHMRKELVLGPGLPVRTLEFGDGNVANLNLGMAVPLYTGGELSHAAAAATAGRAAAVRRQDSARLDLTRAVRQTYCGALGRQAQVEAARLAVGRLERHLAELDGAVAAGAATPEAHLRAGARLNQAAQRLTAAEAARDSAGLALGRLVGRSGSMVRPLGNLDGVLLPAGLDMDTAMGDRADVAALTLEQERQRSLAAAARGRLLPRVVADVRAHYGRPGVDALTNEWMGYGTAAVSVDWPLWDGGARSRQAAQAEARAARLAAQQRDLEEALVTAVGNARTALRAATAQEQQCRQRVQMQKQLLAMVEGRRAQQAASETEYLDAQDDLANAELDLALATTRVRLAEAALLWALGR